MDEPISDLKFQHQADLTELGVGLLDPVSEAISGKGGHIAGEDEIDELANGFPLFLGAGMKVHTFYNY